MSHSFLLCSAMSQVYSQFTGRQERWRRAAVPLPKLTASKDERPPLIAAVKAGPLHVHWENALNALYSHCQPHSHTLWQWWNYLGEHSEHNSVFERGVQAINLFFIKVLLLPWMSKYYQTIFVLKLLRVQVWCVINHFNCLFPASWFLSQTYLNLKYIIFISCSNTVFGLFDHTWGQKRWTGKWGLDLSLSCAGQWLR